MTINHMSGNFQPLTVISGGSLPQSNPQRVSTSPLSEQQPLVAPLGQAELEAEIKLSLSSLETEVEQQVQNRPKVDNYEKLSHLTQNIQRKLSFRVDDASGKTVISVFDRETEELIRQFPPEELLNLSTRLKELNEQGIQSTASSLLIQSEA